jgi:hypothetical protein
MRLAGAVLALTWHVPDAVVDRFVEVKAAAGQELEGGGLQAVERAGQVRDGERRQWREDACRQGKGAGQRQRGSRASSWLGRRGWPALSLPQSLPDALPASQASPATHTPTTHLADEALVVALKGAGEDVKVEGASAVGSILPHKGCRGAGEVEKHAMKAADGWGWGSSKHTAAAAHKAGVTV